MGSSFGGQRARSLKGPMGDVLVATATKGVDFIHMMYSPSEARRSTCLHRQCSVAHAPGGEQ